MSSEAQILANRLNAEKSTGPRTEEGKAVASQNAVKHGLSARQDIISTEDRDQFEIHHRQMLDDLAPVGPLELVLADRIVSLSWRLKRAERIQNEAFDYLLAKGSRKKAGEFTESAGDSEDHADLEFGQAIVTDFANERALERLMIYERRIESSVYRTISQLRTQQIMRESESNVRPMARPPEPTISPFSKTNPILRNPTGHDGEANPVHLGSFLHHAPPSSIAMQARDRPALSNRGGG
jgi:hypothetical protein